MVPDGYVHKATSESFTRAEKVVIYHSKVDDMYLVQIETPGKTKSLGILTASQLELIIHAGGDVLHDSRV